MGYFHFGYPRDFSNTMIPLKLNPTCFFIKDGYSIVRVALWKLKHIACPPSASTLIWSQCHLDSTKYIILVKSITSFLPFKNAMYYK